MRSRQSVHVINFAIRTAAIVIRRSIPACQSSLDKNRFRASGNFERVMINRCRNGLCGWKPNASGTRIRRANRRRRRDIDVRLFMSTAACQQKRKQSDRNRTALRE
jgi:hypothetical protein